MLDLVGPVTTFSFANRVISTVDFSVSYYSTAKIQVKNFLVESWGVTFFHSLNKFKGVLMVICNIM